MQTNTIVYETTAGRSQDRFALTVNTALLTRPDAAIRLATSLRTVDELIATGDLPVVRIGRSVRIRPSALDYLIEARESRVNPRKVRPRLVNSNKEGATL